MPMEKAKNFLRDVGKFFTSLFNLTSYTENQGRVDQTLIKISNSLTSINGSITNINSALQTQSERMTAFNTELTKVKDGLQMELFASLQNLHSYLVEGKKYATPEDKAEATRFYDQIHNLGKDGWSRRYYEEIMELPESKEEYYKQLNK